jgi:hypothetical protein
MQYVYAYPILPGKEDAAQAATAELLGSRRAEYDEFQRRSGVERESYFLQRGPQGSMVIVVGEGSDQSGGLSAFDPEHHDIDRYMLETLRDLTGVDITQGDPPPPPELLGEWRR